MGNIFVAPIMIHKHVSVSFSLNQDSNLVPELDIPGILQTNKAKVALNSKITMVNVFFFLFCYCFQTFVDSIAVQRMRSSRRGRDLPKCCSCDAFVT